MGIFSPLIYPLYKSGEIIPIWGILFILLGSILVIESLFNMITNSKNMWLILFLGIMFIILGILLIKIGKEVIKRRKEKSGISLFHLNSPLPN